MINKIYLLSCYINAVVSSSLMLMLSLTKICQFNERYWGLDG